MHRLDIDKRSSIPVYQQVFEQMQRAILSGELPEGAQLTSVRELSSRLGVNPMTVSKAYSELERLDFVERRKGIGLFVRAQTEKTLKKAREELLKESLEQAALCCVQLGFGVEESVGVFRSALKNFVKSSKQGKRK